MPDTAQEQWAGRPVATCLVVDDDPFDRRMLRRCVQRDRPDLSLLECDTISAARDLLKDTQPDLILLDHRMPDGTGSEFATELRRDARLRETMICVVTNADLTSLSSIVPTLSKSSVTARTIWDMVAEFSDLCETARPDGAAIAAAEMADAFSRLSLPVARMLLSVRMARANFGADASDHGHDELDKLEGMLLTLSDMLSEELTPPAETDDADEKPATMLGTMRPGASDTAGAPGSMGASPIGVQ